jgi:hypothetical protein
LGLQPDGLCWPWRLLGVEDVSTTNFLCMLRNNAHDLFQSCRRPVTSLSTYLIFLERSVSVRAYFMSTHRLCRDERRHAFLCDQRSAVWRSCCIWSQIKVEDFASFKLTLWPLVRPRMATTSVVGSLEIVIDSVNTSSRVCIVSARQQCHRGLQTMPIDDC